MNRTFGSDDRVRMRVSTLGLVMLFLISILAARLWFLQVLTGQDYARAATANRVRLVEVPAPRGEIMDRNGHVIVGRRSSLIVGIRKSDLHDPNTVLPALAQMLHMKLGDVMKRLNDPRVSPYVPVTIASDVPTKTWLQLRERKDDFPGVETDVREIRLYPGLGGICPLTQDGRCSIAAHLIGYVGEISDAELQALQDKGYRAGDQIGRAGLEHSYEDVLRGQPGLQKLEVDSRGVVLGQIGQQAPVPGKDLQLTLDLNTQRIAEDSLAQGIDRARAQVFHTDHKPFKAPGGAVVVLDATNGEIRAMASYPTFDLRKFASGIDPTYWKYLNDPKSDFPLLDRAIQSAFPPGSTIKPFLATAALATGAATPNTQFPCTTDFKFGTQIFHNWTPENTQLTLAGALQISCDTPFYTLGRNWWLQERAREAANQTIYETAADWARKFGLGRPTNIDLAGETQGVIPGRAYKQEVWRVNHEQWCALWRKTNNPGWEDLCQRGYLWRGGDAVNAAIGQGDVAITPLQLADAYAALANGGTVVQPHLGLAVVDPETQQVVRQIVGNPLGHVAIPAAVHDYVVQALEGVAESGTGHAPFSTWPFSRIKVAVKTGSAEIGGRQPYSWFAAFAPADHPKYVVVSVVEQAGFGSQVSGPIVRRIMDSLFGLPLTPIYYDVKRSD
ncbi:MAG: penicillin-binding protein 2 [Actinomycetota bacterium]